MLKFTYDISQFELKFGLPKGSLYSKVVILDIENMNDISPGWVYTEGRACIVGFISENRVEVMLAETENDEYFTAEVGRAISKYGSRAPVLAFNCNMERGALSTMFGGFQFNVGELKPVSGPGWNLDKCYKVLREFGLLKNDIEIVDPFKGNGNLTADRWQKHRASGEMQPLMEIVEHSLSCLIREALIYNNRAWYRAHYKLNERNFEVGK